MYGGEAGKETTSLFCGCGVGEFAVEVYGGF
jgi:hypothetical protein